MSNSPEKRIKAKPNTTTRFSAAEGVLVTNGSNGNRIERQYRLNPETPEEREKRLEKRKALTLEVFQLAFENNKAEAE